MSGARIKTEYIRQAVAAVPATAQPDPAPDAAAPKVHTGGYVLHKGGRGAGSKTNGGWKQRSKQKKVQEKASCSACHQARIFCELCQLSPKLSEVSNLLLPFSFLSLTLSAFSLK